MAIEGLERRHLLATFVVDNYSDLAGGSPTAGTLRWALTQTNLWPDADEIVFDPDVPSASEYRITLSSPLPAITAPVSIDGTVGTTSHRATIDGHLLAVSADGLSVAANDCTVQKLSIVGFDEGAGITIDSDRNRIQDCLVGVLESGAVLANQFGIWVNAGASLNRLGVDISQVPFVGAGNVISGNTSHGVVISGEDALVNSVSGNTIGGNATGNLAVPNGGYGVVVYGGPLYTFIGAPPFLPDPTGVAANVIVGNLGGGIYILDVYGSEGGVSSIAGNWIGVNKVGTVLANQGDGIRIEESSYVVVGSMDDASIPGALYGPGNVIAGNTGHGAHVLGESTEFIGFSGNTIGLASSTAGSATGNGGAGILVEALSPGLNGPQNVFIGGLLDANDPLFIGNTIAGNGQEGIGLRNLQGDLNNGKINVVAQNRIGINANSQVVGNAGDGVRVENSSAVLIGGGATSLGNTISGNQQHGVRITGSESFQVLVAGNAIGTNGAGTTALSNRGNGVQLDSGAHDNVIGRGVPHGSVPDVSFLPGNVISGNGVAGYFPAGDWGNGVLIRDAATNDNVVGGNWLGVNATGTNAVPNLGDGVQVRSARNNRIGGSSATFRNVISGNVGTGVRLTGDVTALNPSSLPPDPLRPAWENTFSGWKAVTDAARWNRVEGNYIGTRGDGLGAIANQEGIRIERGAYQNVVGVGAMLYYWDDGKYATLTPLPAYATAVTGSLQGFGNIVSGNSLDGVAIDGSFIHAADRSPHTSLLYPGTEYFRSAPLYGEGTAFNTVGGNTIGLGADGLLDLGNGGAGISMRDGAKFNYIGNIGLATAIEPNYLALGTLPPAWNGAMPSADTDTDLNHASARNVISGNNGIGVVMSGFRPFLPGELQGDVFLQPETYWNRVAGNYVGVAADGATACPNAEGVVMNSAALAQIIGQGGDDAFETYHVFNRNVISGNTGAGVRITDRGSNVNNVGGNYIGTNATGTMAVPNGVGVVVANNAAQNAVGTDNVNGPSFAGNLIAGNLGDGIRIEDVQNLDGLEPYYNYNAFAGNWIGVSVEVVGTELSLPNQGNGISVMNSGRQLIGGELSLARNLIRNNLGDGVHLENTQRTEIYNNDIRLNQGDGVEIAGNSSFNQIGVARETYYLLEAYPSRVGIDIPYWLAWHAIAELKELPPYPAPGSIPTLSLPTPPGKTLFVGNSIQQNTGQGIALASAAATVGLQIRFNDLASNGSGSTGLPAVLSAASPMITTANYAPGAITGTFSVPSPSAPAPPQGRTLTEVAFFARQTGKTQLILLGFDDTPGNGFSFPVPSEVASGIVGGLIYEVVAVATWSATLDGLTYFAITSLLSNAVTM